MSLEQDLAELSRQLGHFYKLRGGERDIPSEDDFRIILDEAVRLLHKATPGTAHLKIGRLIVERSETGDYDVYVHVGSYK